MSSAEEPSLHVMSDERSAYHNLFNGPPKRNRRRSRVIFDDVTVAHLEKEFLNDQYPCVTKREEIAEKVHIPESRIHTWFQNKRSRVKRQLCQTMHRPKADEMPRSRADKRRASSLVPPSQAKSRKLDHPYLRTTSSPVSTPTQRPVTSFTCPHAPSRPVRRNLGLGSVTHGFSPRYHDDVTSPLDLRISPGVVKPMPVRSTRVNPHMWLSPISNMMPPNMISVTPQAYVMNSPISDGPSPLMFTQNHVQAHNPLMGGLSWLHQGSQFAPFVLPPPPGLLSFGHHVTPPRDLDVSPATDSSGYTSSSVASPMHSPIDVCN